MKIGNTRYNVGFLLGIKAFTAAVLGGIGNLRGAAIGGLLLGLVENYGVGAVRLAVAGRGRVRRADRPADVPADRSAGRVVGEGAGMTALRERWHSASSAIGRRVDGLPKSARITGLLAFVAFLYVLPNKWFYEYLNIPGLRIPLNTTRIDWPRCCSTARGSCCWRSA